MTSSSINNDSSLILAISASHNGSVCLLRGPEIIVAIQEERLTRVKRKSITGSQPCLAIQYCLQSASINVQDIDLIVVSVQGHAQSKMHDASRNPQLKNRRNDVKIIYISHHLCHAISAFATSGLSQSDILVIDGAGSPKEDLPADEQRLTPNEKWGNETLSCYQALNQNIAPLLKHIMAPANIQLLKGVKPITGPYLPLSSTDSFEEFGDHAKNKHQHTKSPVVIGSLGSMFEAVSLIIFGERMQAGKVMGLAAYGEPTIPVIEFLSWHDGKISYSHQFADRFKDHSVWPEHAQAYKNLACSVQQALEYAALKQIEWFRRQTQGKNLCYAGGVALNTLLNERIIRESGYEQVYIIPAAEDSGVAIGAAYYGLWQLSGQFLSKPLFTDSLGHHYSDLEISTSLSSLPGLKRSNSAEHNEQALLDKVVTRLCSGEVGGWFQGGSELGPRALGQRSMLCDPRSPTAKDYLNNNIKHREEFRPFAPMVLAEYAQDWFEFADTEPLSPFMLRVADVLPHARDLIPAVMHIDGSARVQTITEKNGLLYRILLHFYATTGVPVLLNTSFNIAGEPIVETPEDAWRCLQTSPLTFTVVNGQLIEKQHQQQSLLDFTPTKTVNRYALVKKESSMRPSTIVKIWTDTPWGELESTIPISNFSLLNSIDGKRSGLEIMTFRRLDPNNAEYRQAMINGLRALHQIHAIRFTE